MQFREIVSGLGFLEGPLWLSDGSLVVTDVEHGALLRVDPTNGAVETLAHVGGGPNGAAIGPDGAIYVCNNGGMAFAPDQAGFKAGVAGRRPVSEGPPGIQRVTLDGQVSMIYTGCQGQPLLKPNDLVFDKDGGFYFTDTGRAEERHAFLGGLYYATVDGSSIVEMVHSPRPHLPLTQPNGVGLSPDGDVLHVAETGHCRIASWDVASPGQLVASDAPAAARLMHGVPGHMFDSLAIDAEGNVCVATLNAGAISVFSPGGELQQLIELPIWDPGVTNLCFGGSDDSTIFVTSSGRGAIWEITGYGSGLPLAFTG